MAFRVGWLRALRRRFRAVRSSFLFIGNILFLGNGYTGRTNPGPGQRRPADDQASGQKEAQPKQKAR
jgi:hypothetical protein